MRIFKRILAAAMAAALCIPCSMQTAYAAAAEKNAAKEEKAAEENTDYRYFYYQLTPSAKKLYDAMYNMYKDGTFKRGEDCDLLAGGYVAAEQLDSYAREGNMQLLNDMGAARDAFEMDYPDVFYVDFSAISIRVKQDSAGFHGYLGAGRREDYFMPGYTPDNIDEAVAKYNAAVDKVVDIAKAAKPAAGRENQAPAKTMAEAVHTYIVDNMVYKYEDEVTDDRCNSRTAYDSLIYGEGVCEAYTRAYKAVLDRLGIPCICVYGVYRGAYMELRSD